MLIVECLTKSIQRKMRSHSDGGYGACISSLPGLPVENVRRAYLSRRRHTWIDVWPDPLLSHALGRLDNETRNAASGLIMLFALEPGRAVTIPLRDWYIAEVAFEQ